MNKDKLIAELNEKFNKHIDPAYETDYAKGIVEGMRIGLGVSANLVESALKDCVIVPEEPVATVCFAVQNPDFCDWADGESTILIDAVDLIILSQQEGE